MTNISSMVFSVYKPHLRICLLFALVFPLIKVNSQVNISFFVKDKDTQLGIPYASVSISGTSFGNLTDVNGNFKSISPNDTLKISAIGYNNETIIIKNINSNTVYLRPTIYNLNEVKVKPQKLKYKLLGSNAYAENVCTAFSGLDTNWLGKQVAIPAGNKDGLTVYLESFQFYIIKNEYTDSLTFRLMLYEANEKGYPGETFLKNPIFIKTKLALGEVTIDLKPYKISTTGEFFIGIECLEDKMSSEKFCFAGSIHTPSYFKTSPFSKWKKVKGGGGALNIKVSYRK